MTAPASAPVLRLDHVGHRIAGRAIVDDVSLSLAAGRLTVIVGPNGAGKTTLLRLASGETVAESGRVVWNGTDVRDLPVWRLAAIRAVMSQSTEIGFSFPVAEVVGLGFDGVGRRSPGARLAAVARALEIADVGHLAARDVLTLSGGERQRVLFARALAQLEAGRAEGAPRALLLDEPVASLDLSHQIALMESARAVADGGVAVLAILHDLNLAAAFADTIVVLHAGRIAAEGPPREVVTDAVLAHVFGLARRRSDTPAVDAGTQADIPLVTPRNWRVLATRPPGRSS